VLLYSNGSANNLEYQSFGNNNANSILFRSAKGTNTTPLYPDGAAFALGQNQYQGWNESTSGWSGTRANFKVETSEAWTATAQGTRFIISLTPSGSTTAAEVFRISDAGAIQMGGANTVISSARHHQLRSYTVAGLPSAATAGEMIYVSNESGGAVPAFADGTNWRRVTDRAVVT
jgi:hypothetical protein